MRAGRVGVGGAGVVGRPSSAASGLEARYKAIKVLGQGSFGKALLVEEVETKKLFVVSACPFKTRPSILETCTHDSGLDDCCNRSSKSHWASYLQGSRKKRNKRRLYFPRLRTRTSSPT